VADASDGDQNEGERAAVQVSDDVSPARKGLTVGDLLRAAALDRPIAELDSQAFVAAHLSLSKQALGASLTGIDFSKLALVAPRLTLSEALVGDWRARLLEGQPRISGLVATDMSRH
jgi:hypothetical protein